MGWTAPGIRQRRKSEYVSAGLSHGNANGDPPGPQAALQPKDIAPVPVLQRPAAVKRPSRATRPNPVSRPLRRTTLRAVASKLRVPKGSCGLPWSDSTALRRFDQEGGTQVGRDLVPCSRLLYFEASNVVHTISYEDDHEHVTTAKLEIQEHIFAELVPEKLSSRTYLNAPGYYMLGYLDAVKNISLEISRCENDDHCTISSFEKFRDDMGLDYLPHSLHFSVSLSANNFDSISQLVRLNRLDRLSLSVKFPDGFYSKFDVSGYDHIDSIYILSNSALKELNPEKYSEHLPVTGKVVNFILYAGSKVSVGTCKENDEDARAMDSEQDPNNDRLLAIEAQMERTNTLLSNATDTIENVNGLLRPMRFFFFGSFSWSPSCCF